MSENTSALSTPTAVKRPKYLTGIMSEVARDRNPAAVVREAIVTGAHISCIVVSTTSLRSACGREDASSWYRFSM